MVRAAGRKGAFAAAVRPGLFVRREMGQLPAQHHPQQLYDVAALFDLPKGVGQDFRGNHYQSGLEQPY